MFWGKRRYSGDSHKNNDIATFYPPPIRSTYALSPPTVEDFHKLSQKAFKAFPYQRPERNELFLQRYALEKCGNSDTFDPNMVRKIIDMGLPWPATKTDLHEAVAFHCFKEVENLIEVKSNLEARDMHGRTPLIIAAQQFHYSIMSALLKAKARPNAQSNLGNTALMWASRQQDNSSFIELLLQANACPNT